MHSRSPNGHNSPGPAHSQGPFGPFSLAGGRAGLRTRPTVSRMRGSTHPLFKAGDLLADCLRIVHNRSLGQHLRVVHIEGLGGNARPAVGSAVGRHDQIAEYKLQGYSEVTIWMGALGMKIKVDTRDHPPQLALSTSDIAVPI